jgi:hypothetical protein
MAGEVKSTNSSEISGVTARGNITVKTTNRLYLGGFAGKAWGTNPAIYTITNSFYENGVIKAEVSDGNQAAFIGGFAGFIGDDTGFGPTFIGCWSKAGNISVSYYGTNTIYLGGFIGVLSNTDISDCYSVSPLQILEAPDVGEVNIGGFIGKAQGDNVSSIKKCYSAASLSVTGVKSQTNNGGLIGYVQAPSANDTINRITVSQCYATGDIYSQTGGLSCSGGLLGYTRGVTVSECWAAGKVTIATNPDRTGDGRLLAGGLVGYVSHYSVIEDSYARGNVEVDNPYTTTGNIGAGGIAGFTTYYPTIRRCFATGSVLGQGANNTSYNIHTGGIVGLQNYIENKYGVIENCVALNQRITAIGGHSGPTAKRIYGWPGTDVGNNNYALAGMVVGTASSYLNPTITWVTTPTSAPNGPHGQDITAADARDLAQWTTTMGFFGASSPWSATGIGRGYPRLAWEFE